jgi:hypothetical protein
MQRAPSRYDRSVQRGRSRLRLAAWLCGLGIALLWDLPVSADPPTPQPLDQVLTDISQQLRETLAQAKLSRVGILEFTENGPGGESLGDQFGLLGRFCAEQIERRLAGGANGTIQVASREEFQRAQSEMQFALADLKSPTRIQKLAQRAGALSAIVEGTFVHRKGRLMSIQWKVLRTDDGHVVGGGDTAALLGENDLAMMGRSVQISADDRRLRYGPSGQLKQSEEDSVAEKLDEEADGPHPLRDKNFPFRVYLRVNSQIREPVFIDKDAYRNKCFVPLRKGEVYEIWVENNTDQIVLMRLLVDGLNTLPEKEGEKGIKLTVTGKRVGLQNAKHWELDPADGKVFAVRGFVTEKGPQGKLREFVVVDAEESVAARRKFTDQIGIITAAFYAPDGASRGKVGTGQGDQRNEAIGTAHDLKPGKLLGVVHLRYVEPEALDEIRRP